MVLNNQLQVPTPTNGIIIRKTGTHQYVYKVTKTYRNKTGQPTNTRTIIGKIDPKTNQLIPNNTYYQHYTNTNQTTTNTNQPQTYQNIHTIGASFLLKKLFNNLKITPILKDTFGEKRATSILTAAKYMATQGNIIEHIQNWSQTHILHNPTLCSPDASQLFATITPQEKLTFFKAWIKNQPHPPKYLAYDLTSCSSYATNIAELEWGHNRDKEKLPQINIGCYIDQKSGRPLFYVTYPRSIVDKSHLPYMMSYNKTLGVDSATCHVMDRGFCSAANFLFMAQEGLSYLVGVEIDHKEIGAAIVSVREGMVSMRNRVLDSDVYARVVCGEFYGVRGNLHVFFDPDLAHRQRCVLYRKVEVGEQTLGQLAQLTRREARRYRRYFKIDLADEGSFRFERDYAKIDLEALDCGFFCLLTNTENSSGEVLVVYRRRDVLEKGFDDLKNYIDIKRMHVHSFGVLEGKLFCAFIALIAVCELSALLGEFMRSKSLSKAGLITELEKIKVVTMPDGSHLINPLTKTQRTILEICGTTETDLKQYLTNN